MRVSRPADPIEQSDAQQALDRLLRLGAQYSAAPAGAYAAAHQLPPVRITSNPPMVAPAAHADLLELASDRLRKVPQTVEWIRRMVRRETLPAIGI